MYKIVADAQRRASVPNNNFSRKLYEETMQLSPFATSEHWLK